MFKLAVLFALVAAAFAAPQYLLGSPLSSPLVSGIPALSRFAYSGYNAPALAYNSPLAYSSPAVAYSAPAPYAYQTEPLVSYAAEPVEQHGYRIAY